MAKFTSLGQIAPLDRVSFGLNLLEGFGVVGPGSGAAGEGVSVCAWRGLIASHPSAASAQTCGRFRAKLAFRF